MRLTQSLLSKWKEAATCILYSRTNQLPSPSLASGSAAVATPTPGPEQSSTHNDFKLLILERSSKSTFFPSAFVFPGGAISKTDHSIDWHSLYRDCGITDINTTIPIPNQPSNSRPPMLSKERDWPISADVAFRLCSIRETFEESGVLLCKHKKDLISPAEGDPHWQALDKKRLQEWRPLIQKDDHNFIDMCGELSVVPDIWALYEWSCWLTPTNMDEIHSGRRYDTMFYICGLPNQVDAVHDMQEIVHSKWMSPAELLVAQRQEKLMVGPPQITELRRLGNFSSFDSLEDFSAERQKFGCERWLPVRMQCTDGTIAVAPGDDLYPKEKELDIEGKCPAAEINSTMSESTSATKNLHRFEFHSMTDIRLVSNIDPTHGHMNTRSIEDIIAE